MRRGIEEGRWSELRRRLYRFVGRRLRNPQEAEDVVQDIYVRIHRNIEELSSAERLDAWAFRIPATPSPITTGPPTVARFLGR